MLYLTVWLAETVQIELQRRFAELPNPNQSKGNKDLKVKILYKSSTYTTVDVDCGRTIMGLMEATILTCMLQMCKLPISKLLQSAQA